MNITVLEGRLVRDIELKQTQSGVPVASFTLAVNRQYRSGEDTQADFINIVAWRHSAEFVAKYFRKGDGMSVVGSIQTRNYTDNAGQTRNVFEVVAQSVEFPLGRSKQSTQESVSGVSGAIPGAEGNTAENASFEAVGNEDDLPF